MTYSNPRDCAVALILIVTATLAGWLVQSQVVLAQKGEPIQNSQRAPAQGHLQGVKLFDSVLRGTTGNTSNEGTHPSRLIVRFVPTATAAVIAKSNQSARQAQTLRSSTSVPGLMVIQVSAVDRTAALNAYQNDPNVLYAELDYPIKINAVPNDPRLGELWGLLNNGQVIAGQVGVPGADIRAAGAWDFWTGDPNFRIAVIDTGIDLTHPDLAENIWTNPNEIPGNGIDDDQNGWIDDVHGYDFFDNDSDPSDENGHGTHVSGTIGAVGDNNLGVVGVNWRCKLVALKIFGPDGSGFVSDAIEAFDYVTANGLTISNNSWETTQFSQGLEDAIAATQAVDHLVIAAAGNSLGRNIDLFPSFPAALDLPNVIAVAGTANDDVALFVTNIGPKTVDVGAPGEAILSTELGGMYGFRSGTSMSTAYVTGTAALLRSRLPGLTSDQVIARLRGTARPIAALQGRILTGGVVNATAAVADCNHNGLADEIDIQTGTSLDCDGNSLPDECQPDCNSTGSADSCDIASGASLDCNTNGVPDECDLSAGTSLDCNMNSQPDECDLASGLSQDLNGSNIPDACETCTLASECQDGNPCTDDLCTNGLCQVVNNTAPCDDQEMCTDNDTCSGGVCRGTVIPSLACAPRLRVVATAVNGAAFPDGSREQLTLARGDRVTIEMFAGGWRPRSLRAYSLVFQKDTFKTGSTGSLVLANDANGMALAFIDETRGDYLFPGLTTIAGVDTMTVPDRLSYFNVLLFDTDCQADTNTEKYLGTLVLDASSTASGTFSICLDPNTLNNTVFVDCDTSLAIEPLNLACLTINIPLSNCDTGVDCNGNGVWDICDIGTGVSLDCNRNDIPDDCEIADGSVPDCNGNQVPDECDIADNTSADCSANGIPDECEVDCNGNGEADSCDLLNGVSQDCNGNGILDECDIFYVKADAQGANDGTSWNDAFVNLNKAIAASAETCGGSQVWVAAGVYTPPDFVSSRFITFRLRNDTTILGGFAGFESMASERRPIANPTILSGDLLGNDSSDPASRADNAFHVVDGSGTSRSAVLDGFVIRGGQADGNNRFSDGGGLLLDRGSPRIQNCRFLDNFAARDGGALFTRERSPLFFNCVFSGNRAGANGGAIFHTGGTLSLSNCTITLNNARLAGGGIASFRVQTNLAASAAVPGRVEIINSIVWRNTENENPIPSFRTQIEAESPRAFYSNIQGLIGQLNGNNNQAEDPMFVDDDGPDNIPGNLDDDLRLSQGSKSIDAASIFSSIALAADIQGDDRVQNCRVDQGAFESPFFADCNGDNSADSCEAMDGRVADCNQNQVPDDCEPDCNSNGQADQCDIDLGLSTDCNSNLIPDDCEPDCNNNGRADDCDITARLSPDCNRNAVPDECDLATATSQDCDANQIPDECDARTDYVALTPSTGPIDRENPVQFVFESPPSATDVVLSIAGRGDFASPTEFLTIIMNGTTIGTVFEEGVRECNNGFDLAKIVIPRDTFNALLNVSTVVLDIVASDQVDPNVCAVQTSVFVRLEFQFAGLNDCDVNLVPDRCQSDRDGDGVIDACDECPDDPAETVATVCGCGIPAIDTDGDTVPDCLDRCPSIDDLADLDGNGVADCAEAIPTVSDWGLSILALLLLIAAKISRLRPRDRRFVPKL